MIKTKCFYLKYPQKNKSKKEEKKKENPIEEINRKKLKIITLSVKQQIK